MAKYTVKNLMAPNPVIISPDSSLLEATEAMAEIDCGVLPVGTPDQLIGMITDRDIAIRAIAKGLNPAKTSVSDVMTHKVFFIQEDAGLDKAADLIRKQKVNRLVVKNAKGRITGILSISGLIREAPDAKALTQFVKNLASANHRSAA